MNASFTPISDGTVTSPQGFMAGAVCSGASDTPEDRLGVGILYSEVPCVAAGVFTTNRIKAAPVVLSQKHLVNRQAQAVVVNSGCANACCGERGYADAAEMATLAAGKLGIAFEDLVVASTGRIGMPLPMERVRAGIEKIAVVRGGGRELAEAIMTTDTFPKGIAMAVDAGEARFTIGGIAKGAGMIHPDLATMLCFLATDGAVDSDFIKVALKEAVDASFNMITVDGDNSPNDTVVILANGLVGGEVLRAGTTGGEAFQAALGEVCLYLAKCIARDGEGATKLIEVTVDGALTVGDARLAARTIAGSSLVKAAVHGCEPNWGRIVAALGRSEVEGVESRVDLYLDNICLTKAGCPLPFDEGEAIAALSKAEVPIRLHLNLGREKATAWGCDLSEEYVTLNSSSLT